MVLVSYLKKSIGISSLIICLATNCPAQNVLHFRGYLEDTTWKNNTDSIIVGKVFYLLAVFNQSKVIRQYLLQDKTLDGIANQRIEEAEREIHHCDNMSCYASLISWSPHQVYLAGNELVNLMQRNVIFREALVSALKRDGSYINYERYGDEGMVRMAWYDCALGINYILNVYVKGEAPMYPLIDSISFPSNAPKFKRPFYEDFLSTLYHVERHHDLFFVLPLDMALKALRLNGRNEAARYEPMKGGMNALPYKEVKHTVWNHYPYSAILIPGEGPEKVGVPLNPIGAYRCRLAAERFKKGLAPFIITSGGHVHPYKTPFSEAVEMKEYLVDSLNIPAAAVIIEPHARHTTTNIRNTCRIIIHFGMPFQKPLLIVTDTAQNNYISTIDERNREELGYLPYAHLKKISPNETIFYPVKACLQENPFDPLDP